MVCLALSDRFGSDREGASSADQRRRGFDSKTPRTRIAGARRFPCRARHNIRPNRASRSLSAIAALRICWKSFGASSPVRADNRTQAVFANLRAPWMAIDADRVEREPIVARPLAPLAALRAEANPARSARARSLRREQRLARRRRGGAPARRAHECRRACRLGGARRPSDIPSLTRDAQFGSGVRRGLLSARVGDRYL
jgi:hypothetical protein